MLNKLVKSSAVGAMLLATPAAHAAIVVTSGSTPGTTTAVVNTAVGPNSALIRFNGFSGSGSPAIDNLTASLLLNFVGKSGSTYNFTYTLKNTSSDPVSSTVVIFGFSTDPNFTNVSGIGGTFDQVVFGTKKNGSLLGSQPNGLPDIEFCLKDQGPDNNCTAGQLGLDNQQETSGAFSLEFAQDNPSITLSDFSVRYQSVAGAGQVTSASGVPFGLVPEPATWAMMILGFGLIGGALRSRKAQATRVTYA